MTTVNRQQSKFSPDEKFYYSNSIPPCKIVIISASVPLWHMGHKKVKDISKNKEIFNLKLDVCIFLTLKHNREFKEQV